MCFQSPKTFKVSEMTEIETIHLYGSMTYIKTMERKR